MVVSRSSKRGVAPGGALPSTHLVGETSPADAGLVLSDGILDSSHLQRLPPTARPLDVPPGLQATSSTELTPSTLVDSQVGAIARPTYVSLPSPRSFSSNSLENQPPPTNSTFKTSMTSSSISTSPMTAFDNCFAHGSPESSTAAVNVEPGMHVLVVDDDPLTRTLMTRILSRLGCLVTTAENGVMAIDLVLGVKGYAGVPMTPSKEEEKMLVDGRLIPGGVPLREGSTSSKEGVNAGVRFQEEADVDSAIAALGPPPQDVKFAVIFLDNQMPVMSGVKAVERLRELGRKDFVVGVTGNALLSGKFIGIFVSVGPSIDFVSVYRSERVYGRWC